MCSGAARSGHLKIGRKMNPPVGYHSLDRLPLPPITLLGEVPHTREREMIREYRRTLGSSPVPEAHLLGAYSPQRGPLRTSKRENGPKCARPRAQTAPLPCYPLYLLCVLSLEGGYQQR